MAAYLATQELKRWVQAQFSTLPDPKMLWQSQEFARIRRHCEWERLTLDNVLISIELRRNLFHLLRVRKRVVAGDVTLARFVKIIITPRHRLARNQ